MVVLATIMTKSLEKGSKYENGIIIIDMEKKQMDADKSDDEVTINVIKDIADSIDDMIKFTVDYPSNHESRNMPILDLQVRVNVEKDNRLDFQFYEKPTRNNRVILSNAAISSKQKRTILTQECLRRLRNTKIELGRQIQVSHLNEFMLKLKNSGYSKKYRKEILISAEKAFEEMVKNDKEGVKPLFRSRDWNSKERKQQKENKKLQWYKKGVENRNQVEFKSVLFVPVTKGGGLARELKLREEEVNKYSKERIKIIEDGGIKLKDFLIKKDPFPNKKCSKKTCIICSSETSENVKYPCNSNNIGYQLKCDTCIKRDKVQIYEGESSRSARIRGEEHAAGLRNKNPTNVLYKHKQNEHKNENMKFSMEITGKFRDPLTRQANEAVRIYSRNKNQLLNSKSEFNHPPTARICVERRKDKQDSFHFGTEHILNQTSQKNCNSDNQQ